MLLHISCDMKALSLVRYLITDGSTRKRSSCSSITYFHQNYFNYSYKTNVNNILFRHHPYFVIFTATFAWINSSTEWFFNNQRLSSALIYQSFLRTGKIVYIDIQSQLSIDVIPFVSKCRVRVTGDLEVSWSCSEDLKIEDFQNNAIEILKYYLVYSMEFK